MGRTIPQRELRNRNAEVVAAVAGGETLVITRNGTPVAELRPIPSPRRTFVSRAELAAISMQGPQLDARGFRRDLDEAAEQALA